MPNYRQQTTGNLGTVSACASCYSSLSLCFSSVSANELCCGNSTSVTVFVAGTGITTLASVTGFLYTTSALDVEAAVGFYSDDLSGGCNPPPVGTLSYNYYIAKGCPGSNYEGFDRKVKTTATLTSDGTPAGSNMFTDNGSSWWIDSTSTETAYNANLNCGCGSGNTCPSADCYSLDISNKTIYPNCNPSISTPVTYQYEIFSDGSMEGTNTPSGYSYINEAGEPSGFLSLIANEEIIICAKLDSVIVYHGATILSGGTEPCNIEA